MHITKNTKKTDSPRRWGWTQAWSFCPRLRSWPLRCVYVYSHISVCVCVCVCTDTHTRACVTHAHSHTRTHAHTHTRKHTHRIWHFSCPPSFNVNRSVHAYYITHTSIHTLHTYVHTHKHTLPNAHIGFDLFAVHRVLQCELQRLCVCVCVCVCLCVCVCVCTSTGLDVLAVNGVVQRESGRAWGPAGRRDVYRHSTRRPGLAWTRNPKP
jgi:hypothetical protein